MEFNTIEKFKKKYFRYKDFLKLGFWPGPKRFFLASYPRSGNTWVRFLLSNIFSSDQITFHDLKYFIPDKHREDDQKIITNPGSTFYGLPVQIVKTHDPYSLLFRPYNVIYLVRDGRDAVTSYYYFLTGRLGKKVSVEDVIRGNLATANWGSHVLGWRDGKSKRKIIIRYEDLLISPLKELQKIMEFIGVDVPADKLTLAIQNADFKSMQKIEDKYGALQESKELPVNFVRRGKVGDWRDLFSKQDEEYFYVLHRKALVNNGYDKDDIISDL